MEGSLKWSLLSLQLWPLIFYLHILLPQVLQDSIVCLFAFVRWSHNLYLARALAAGIVCVFLLLRSRQIIMLVFVL